MGTNYSVTVSYNWILNEKRTAQIAVSAHNAHQAIEMVKNSVVVSAGVRKCNVKLVDVVKCWFQPVSKE